MVSSTQRDQIIVLAKHNTEKALEKAKQIKDPWYQAQALAWTARYSDKDPVSIAKLAAKSASKLADDFKRSSVRAWEVAALSERGCRREAAKSLAEAVQVACTVAPPSSRSEALTLLMQAACSLGAEQAKVVYDHLVANCPVEEHWRCKRAVRNGAQILAGEQPPRPFF